MNNSQQEAIALTLAPIVVFLLAVVFGWDPIVSVVNYCFGACAGVLLLVIASRFL